MTLSFNRLTLTLRPRPLPWLVMAVLTMGSHLHAEDIFDIPDAADYLRRFEKAVVMDATVDALVMQCRVIPDTYQYEILRTLVTLQERGIAGDQLRRSLVKAHKKQKNNRGKTLLISLVDERMVPQRPMSSARSGAESANISSKIGKNVELW